MSDLRTPVERQVGKDLERVFCASRDSVEVRLESFPKYVRRQHITRFLALYELFSRVLHVKGSIIECGVWRGFGLMSWAKFSAVLEPNNLMRRIYGFDTFEGFASVDTSKDRTDQQDLRAESFDELQELIELYDRDRFLGHVEKVRLVMGDAVETIPKFVVENPHLVVSLLFCDFDLYEPTRVALEHFVPRMPKGAIIAFDELDNARWPGETLALLESVGIGALRIQRLDFDPYIGFAVIE